MRARDWDENHIYGLALQEYDDIEFKASPLIDLSTPEKKDNTINGLAKEITALANYGGGFLVLGVKDPKDCKGGVLEIVNGGIPKEFPLQGRSGTVNTAEWLQQNIANMTEHRLQDYEVHPIEHTGESSKIDEGQAVFVIGVPDSPNVPFQNVRDKKYYMRVGGNSEPASHRMVLDIMARRQHPDIQLTFRRLAQTKVKSSLTDLEYGGKPKRHDQTSLIVTATNRGRVLAQYVSLQVWIPTLFLPKNDRNYSFTRRDDGLYFQRYTIKNTKRDVMETDVMGKMTYGPSWYDPILPDLQWNTPIILHPDYATARSKYPADLMLKWTASADNSNRNEGEILWDSIKLDDRRRQPAS